jgi:hypothetical protein
MGREEAGRALDPMLGRASVLPHRSRPRSQLTRDRFPFDCQRATDGGRPAVEKG